MSKRQETAVMLAIIIGILAAVVFGAGLHAVFNNTWVTVLGIGSGIPIGIFLYKISK